MLCLAAYAKINWTLDILGTRPDGYHLMDMLMQTVSLCDLLWMEEAEDLTLEAVPGGTERAARSKTNDGLSSAGVRYDESNLVYRAALLLREHCGVRRGARIQLEKRIPSGAGMGGGSADCAAALKGLNALWGLGLSRAELLSLGLKLGADVPFLITGGLARVGGIGERIQPLLPAPQVWLVLVQPCEGLSTREVFSAFDRMDASSLRHPDNAAAQDALLRRDLTALAPAMANVLQAVSESARPALAQAVRALEAAGAVRAMMTGSGSVVYGVLNAAPTPWRLRRPWRRCPRSAAGGACGLHAPCRAGKKALQSPDKRVIMLSRTGLKGPSWAWPFPRRATKKGLISDGQSYLYHQDAKRRRHDRRTVPRYCARKRGQLHFPGQQRFL